VPYLPPAATPGRPRPQPVLEAEPAHLPRLALDGHGATLTPTLDSLLIALRTGVLSGRPLGRAGSLPAVNPHPARQVILYPYALTGQAGFYHRSSDTNSAGAFYLDGSSLLLVGSETFGGVTLSLTQVTAAHLHGLYLGINFASGGHLINTVLQLQVAPHTVRLGLAGLDADLPNGTFWAIGMMFGLTAHRAAVDGGAYRGLDLEKLAAARQVDLQEHTLRRLELTHLSGQSVTPRVSSGSFRLAGLFRIDFAHSTQTTWRLVRTEAEARALLFEAHGRGFWRRNKLRALGLKPEAVPLAHLDAPQELAIGDEVLQARSYSATPAAIFGNLAVFGGVQTFRRRDREVTVHRLDARRVEVTVSVTRLRNIGAFVCSPFGPELDMGRDVASSLRQSFSIDISTPEGLAAFGHITSGGAAGRWQPQKLTSNDLRLPEMAAVRVREDRPHLLPEVQRNWVHGVLSREARVGAGIDWRFVPNRLTPKGWVFALGRHYSRICETQIITDGGYTAIADVRTHRIADDRFFAGEHSVEATGQMRWHLDDTGSPLFDGLTWRLHLSLSGARSNAVQRRLAKPLRERFGLSVGAGATPGTRQKQTVTLTQAMPAGGLGLPVDHPGHYVQWWQAGHQAGIHPRHAQTLRRRLAAAEAEATPTRGHASARPDTASDPAARRGAILQDFIAQHGAAACALLYHLNGNERTAHVRADSSTCQNALAAANRCIFQYGDSPLAAQTAAAVWRRFCAVVVAQRQLAVAQREADTSPFAVSAGLHPVQEALSIAEAQLAALLVAPDAVRGAWAQALQALAGRRRRAFWCRDGRRLRHALAGWLAPADEAERQAVAVQRAYQTTALPQGFENLLQRRIQVQAALSAIEARRNWLDTADVPMVAAQRQSQKQRLAAMAGALSGTNGVGGLLPLRTLAPHVCRQLAAEGRRGGLSPAVWKVRRPLIRDLDRLGGA
jgi:hypothetical protein